MFRREVSPHRGDVRRAPCAWLGLAAAIALAACSPPDPRAGLDRAASLIAGHVAHAQYQLGLSLREAGDDTAWLAWLQRAAEGGNAGAQRDLGIAFAKGAGVARDDARALRWLRLAAAAHDAPAQNQLGWMFENGLGVAPDDAEAARWYRLAARQGHPAARDNLDFLYMHGRALPADSAEARRLYRARTFR